MLADVKVSSIQGCLEIIPKIFKDDRGIFVKVYTHEFFEKLGMKLDIREQFYSVSKKNVIRGLHFQLPPKEHNKLVYCLYGEVFDVVVDLRVGSPTYGKYETFILSAEKSNILYVPKGLAHGFCVLSEMAIMVYNVDVEFSPEHDSGIRWNSLDIPWPCSLDEAIVSDKDSKLIPFVDFISPFKYELL